MRRLSTSRRPARVVSCLLPLLASLIPGQMPAVAATQEAAPAAGARSSPSILRAPLECEPGKVDARCAARNSVKLPTLGGYGRPARRLSERYGTRFIPPAILAFLHDARIDPYTRAFLTGLAGTPTEDWTLLDLQMVTQLVPTLSETAVPTRTLSDFYQFLGLDPTQLFEPQLGRLQENNTGFDEHNYEAVEQAQCFYLLGYGDALDPSRVLLKDLAACSAAH